MREHPLAWWPTHLEDELRDDLTIEAYWKACLRLGRRSVVTVGCEGRGGLLDAAAWRPNVMQHRRMGPMLWEDGVWEGATTQRCEFVRGLAAHGLNTWAAMTNADTREWLTWSEIQEIHRIPDSMRGAYKTLKVQLDGNAYTDLKTKWRLQPSDGGS